MPVIPIINKITNIKFPSYQNKVLANNVPIYVIHDDTLPIVKLEVIFSGGRVSEKKHSTSRITAGLMNESTQSTSAKEIDETIDFYGGRMGISSNMDTMTASLFCLKKHFKALIYLFGEIISQPRFDLNELETYIKNQKQRLQLSLEENDVVAYRELTANVFGEKHVYGYNSSFEDYDAIKPIDLQDYFQNNFVKENCFVVASGNIGENEFNLIDSVLCDALLENSNFKKPIYSQVEIAKPAEIFIEKKNSVQTAIRVGLKTFTKTHSDYPAFYYLNTVLGGYFGARLMQNIREEKGYTYNIFSSLNTMIYDGFFSIGCEVGNEHKNATIKEIFFEIDKLKTELVSEKEMELVQNFLMGEILKWTDGVYHSADMIKHLVIHGQPISYFETFVDNIQNISAKDLQDMAQKYFQKGSFHTVIVGK